MNGKDLEALVELISFCLIAAAVVFTYRDASEKADAAASKKEKYENSLEYIQKNNIWDINNSHRYVSLDEDSNLDLKQAFSEIENLTIMDFLLADFTLLKFLTYFSLMAIFVLFSFYSLKIFTVNESIFHFFLIHAIHILLVRFGLVDEMVTAGLTVSVLSYIVVGKIGLYISSFWW